MLGQRLEFTDFGFMALEVTSGTGVTLGRSLTFEGPTATILAVERGLAPTQRLRWPVGQLAGGPAHRSER